jgi:hypothetical protein
MIRTVISLDESDKAWLDQQASSRHLPMAELVRQAVRAYRASQPRGEDDFEALLAGTAGTWNCQTHSRQPWPSNMACNW